MILFILCAFVWWFVGSYLGWRLWARKAIQQPVHDCYGRRESASEIWPKLAGFGLLGLLAVVPFVFRLIDKALDKKS